MTNQNAWMSISIFLLQLKSKVTNVDLSNSFINIATSVFILIWHSVVLVATLVFGAISFEILSLYVFDLDISLNILGCTTFLFTIFPGILMSVKYENEGYYKDLKMFKLLSVYMRNVYITGLSISLHLFVITIHLVFILKIIYLIKEEILLLL